MCTPLPSVPRVKKLKKYLRSEWKNLVTISINNWSYNDREYLLSLCDISGTVLSTLWIIIHLSSQQLHVLHNSKWYHKTEDATSTFTFIHVFPPDSSLLSLPGYPSWLDQWILKLLKALLCPFIFLFNNPPGWSHPLPRQLCIQIDDFLTYFLSSSPDYLTDLAVIFICTGISSLPSKPELTISPSPITPAPQPPTVPGTNIHTVV